MVSHAPSWQNTKTITYPIPIEDPAALCPLNEVGSATAIDKLTVIKAKAYYIRTILYRGIKSYF